MDTSYSLVMRSKRLTLATPSRENNHSSSECRPMESQVTLVIFGCSCSRQLLDWPMARTSGGTVFLAAARGLGFETSVLEPCVLVLRSPQQGYHGILGVAVDDIAGGGDEVWEQAISMLKKRFTFGHWEVGKVKFCSRAVVQAADGSMRVGQPAYIKSLDFVPLGKTRKEQSGDATEIESCYEISARSFWVSST